MCQQLFSHHGCIRFAGDELSRNPLVNAQQLKTNRLLTQGDVAEKLFQRIPGRIQICGQGKLEFNLWRPLQKYWLRFFFEFFRSSCGHGGDMVRQFAHQ